MPTSALTAAGTIGVAIGDVMGHDVAAAAMGRLRSVLRSYAYEGSGPAVVLDRLDGLVRAPPSPSRSPRATDDICDRAADSPGPRW